MPLDPTLYPPLGHICAILTSTHRAHTFYRLVVNADTLEGDDEDGSIGPSGRPFHCEQLGQFDFR